MLLFMIWDTPDSKLDVVQSSKFLAATKSRKMLTRKFTVEVLSFINLTMLFIFRTLLIQFY
jgi:hypothetical protein